MCERSTVLPLLKGGLVCRSNPLDSFEGSVPDIRGFILLSDQQNKGKRPHLRWFQGSRGDCRVTSLGQFQDGDTGTNNQCPVREASRTGNGLQAQL